MYATGENATRFREARERAGFAPDTASAQMNISTPSVWDIECQDDELTIYSAAHIQKFCEVLGITPQWLFGIHSDEPPITAINLAALIRENCSSRGTTVEQFEDASGWYVAKALEDPEEFMGDGYCIDGIKDICEELCVDWNRFILGL